MQYHNHSMSLLTRSMLGLVLVTGLTSFSPFTVAAAAQSNLPVAGWIELARLVPLGLDMHAKLDTGAKTTSINAVDPDFFERDGTQWVRFSVANRDGKKAVLEEEIVRSVAIKRHFDGRQQRPVINLEICVGPVRRAVEVNLVDRSGFDYQLLIGRNFFVDKLLVDSGNTYTMESVCSDL